MPQGLLPRWLVLLLLLFGASGAAWVVAENTVWNVLPAALVGKWVVQSGEQEGATFDFYRNGTMLGRINLSGKEGIVNARVRVEDGTIYLATTNPRTGRDDTKALRIHKLTTNELVWEDERGGLMNLERAE